MLMLPARPVSMEFTGQGIFTFLSAFQYMCGRIRDVWKVGDV